MSNRHEYGAHERKRNQYRKAVNYIGRHTRIRFADFVKLSEMIETPSSPAEKWKEIQEQGGLMFQDEAYFLKPEARDIMRSDMLEGGHEEELWLRQHRDTYQSIKPIVRFLFFSFAWVIIAWFMATGSMYDQLGIMAKIFGWGWGVTILYVYVVSPRI